MNMHHLTSQELDDLTDDMRDNLHASILRADASASIAWTEAIHMIEVTRRQSAEVRLSPPEHP